MEVKVTEKEEINRFCRNNKTPQKSGVLLLYTDGLTDLENHSGMFYPDRLKKELRDVKHLRAQDIFFRLKESILETYKRQDDISFIVVKRN